MKGIKMSDCRFYVNEAERVVVCVIPKTKYMVRDFIGENFNWRGDFDFSDYNLNYNLRESLEMPSEFIGKAVCAPEDNWDEDIGRMLAFSRAKDKCYKSFFKRANMFIQKLDSRLGDMISIFNDFGLKLEDRREALSEQINELINPDVEEEE